MLSFVLFAEILNCHRVNWLNQFQAVIVVVSANKILFK